MVDGGSQSLAHGPHPGGAGHPGPSLASLGAGFCVPCRCVWRSPLCAVWGAGVQGGWHTGSPRPGRRSRSARRCPPPDLHYPPFHHGASDRSLALPLLPRFLPAPGKQRLLPGRALLRMREATRGHSDAASGSNHRLPVEGPWSTARHSQSFWWGDPSVCVPWGAAGSWGEGADTLHKDRECVPSSAAAGSPGRRQRRAGQRRPIHPSPSSPSPSPVSSTSSSQ